MRFGTRLRVLAAAATALLLPGTLFTTTSAQAAPSATAVNATVVHLRIEGATRTIFEGPVLTSGHDVTTAAGGTHHCDGTNGGVNPTAGPTATAAVDDAGHLAGFTWDGPYSATFDDYFVSRIGPDSQTDTQFWGLLVNNQFSNVGGCQQRVALGDQVLWAYDAFNAAHYLALTGPAVARAGRPFTLTVTDAMTGDPIAGATVAGRTTGADGTVSVTVARSGVSTFKASRADSIRSNAQVVLVV
jgi:Domain of unknown function (DUF4430)